MHPDLVPNVYLRLWKQDCEPEELHKRKTLVKEAKKAWMKRLRDQGKADGDSDMETT